MTEGRDNESVYRVQTCNFGQQKVAPEGYQSPANIRVRAVVPLSQLLGLQLQLSKMEKHALEKNIKSANADISPGDDDQRRMFQELKFDLKVQKHEVGRMTEDLDKQRVLVKSKRNKAKIKGN